MSHFRVARLAQSDLVRIRDHIARDNPGSADRQAEAFFDMFAALAKHPLMGQDRSDLRKNLRMMSLGNYVVCFYPMKDGVQIARVLHGARDIDAILRSRRK